MRHRAFSVSILICLAVLAALFCPGCGSDEPVGSGTDKSEPNSVGAGAGEPNAVGAGTDEPEPNAVGALAARGVAVVVNDIEILESEVQEIVRPSLEKLTKRGGSMSSSDIAGQTAQLRRMALEQLIRLALLDAQVMQAKIVVTDDQVRGQIEQMAAAQGMTVAAFGENLKRNGRTLEGIRREVRAGLARDQFMAAQWEGKINVTEDDARKYYDENTEEFKVPEQVRASHILITPEVGGDPNEQREKARTKIEGLLAQLKDGADFAELARANSSCPSAPTGGNLDYFTRGEMTPAFEKAAFELEVGELSDVVETDYGFHIIKVADHVYPTVLSFEQARERIIEALTQAKKMEFVKDYLDKLTAEAEIVYPSGT